MAGISATILEEFKKLESFNSSNSLVEDFEKLIEQSNKIKDVVLIEYKNPDFNSFEQNKNLERQVRSDRWYSLAQTLAISENNEIFSEHMKIKAKKVNGYIKLYDRVGNEQPFMYKFIN